MPPRAELWPCSLTHTPRTPDPQGRPRAVPFSLTALPVVIVYYLQKKCSDVHEHSVSVLNSAGFVPSQLWLVFGSLSFDEKKAVAAQLIRKIEIINDSVSRDLLPFVWP